MAQPPTLADLEAAGVYDPTAADADDHGFLLTELVQHGASLDEIRRGYTAGVLPTLLLQLRVIGRDRLTFGELADRADLDPDFLAQVWRGFGFAEPDPDDRLFSTADVEAWAAVAPLRALLGEGTALDPIRAVGIGLAKAAEATVASVRTRLDDPARPLRAPEELRSLLHEWIDDNWVGIEHLVGSVFRQHCIEASRLYQEWDVAPDPHNVVDLVVGFVDLVGSTAAAEHTDLAGFDQVIRRFESIAADLIIGSGATLVKLIGDAAMFTTFAPGVACELALDLVDAFAADDGLPRCKVGMAAGQTVALRGDYFGPVVNLASRLADAASESTILVSPGLRNRVVGVTDSFTFRRVPVRHLAGIDHQSRLWELHR